MDRITCAVHAMLELVDVHTYLVRIQILRLLTIFSTSNYTWLNEHTQWAAIKSGYVLAFLHLTWPGEYHVQGHEDCYFALRFSALLGSRCPSSRRV